MKKLFVIGLDCVPPNLLFNKFIEDLPNIKSLIQKSTIAKLKSCTPPITIPAWSCMTSSKSPGSLGVYGFRHRKNNSYDGIRISTSQDIKHDRVWDILSRKNKKVIVIGVPQTYPPKKVNGYLVSGFLTPSLESEYTYPPEFKQEIKEIVGEYEFDATEYRTDKKDELLKKIYDITKKRFKLIKHLIKNKEWDFFMFVEIATDRLHHGFWKFFDKTHRKYEPNNKYESEILKYYKYLDTEIGELIKLLDKDTKIMLVSDHGVKSMEGCININDLLINLGYLKLKEKPKGAVKFHEANIDWSKTKAWGWGGYYARIFLNVKGREPQGIIKKGDYEAEREKLKNLLQQVKDDRNKEIKNLIFKPEEIYKEPKGDLPDLLAFFGDLAWRSNATIGNNSIYSLENDTGPDDAVHDWNGVFIMYDPKNSIYKEIDEIDIKDIAPTILSILGEEIPQDMEGKVIE
ncbi:MAG: alkaline phosphatase family protein [Nanoarchaeota archaeon]